METASGGSHPVKFEKRFQRNTVRPFVVRLMGFLGDCIGFVPTCFVAFDRFVCVLRDMGDGEIVFSFSVVF